MAAAQVESLIRADVGVAPLPGDAAMSGPRVARRLVNARMYAHEHLQTKTPAPLPQKMPSAIGSGKRIDYKTLLQEHYEMLERVDRQTSAVLGQQPEQQRLPRGLGFSASMYRTSTEPLRAEKETRLSTWPAAERVGDAASRSLARPGLWSLVEPLSQNTIRTSPLSEHSHRRVERSAPPSPPHRFRADTTTLVVLAAAAAAAAAKKKPRSRVTPAYVSWPDILSAQRDVTAARKALLPPQLILSRLPMPVRAASHLTMLSCPDDVPPCPPATLRVVLDLDETLVCARSGPVLLRPGLSELFQGLKREGIEVIVWTAGMRDYAQAILSEIDKVGCANICVHRGPRWFRPEGGKDLSRLCSSSGDLSRIVMVENSPECCALQPQNCIVVPSYFRNDPRDSVLRRICDILNGMADSPSDVPGFLSSVGALQSRAFRTDCGCVHTHYLPS
eukprot:TRINITY_DN2557_c0_g1_i1.p1 TRINITY_DN2557_c0_g1~~TRINITY_DN2557_c0_g1_i1.p1  ORF type:complete len:475 (+),score=94.01 TRINITY_DN2557_c0_g1_i1:87-1427(+)